MADETPNNPAAPKAAPAAPAAKENQNRRQQRRKTPESAAPVAAPPGRPLQPLRHASRQHRRLPRKPNRRPLLASLPRRTRRRTRLQRPVALSLDETIEPLKIVKAKGSKNVTHGIAHVQASFNNTIVSITDQKGAVIGWSSAGKCGFKGSRKSTAYAAQMVAQDACRQAMSHGLREVEVRVKGPGAGRESAVRAMQAVGLEITVITGRHAGPPQWLPPAQTAKSLDKFYV